MADQFQYVKLPDGSYGKFRADAPDSAIKSAISSDFPQAYKAPAQPVAPAPAPSFLDRLHTAGYSALGAADKYIAQPINRGAQALNNSLADIPKVFTDEMPSQDATGTGLDRLLQVANESVKRPGRLASDLLGVASAPLIPFAPVIDPVVTPWTTLAGNLLKGTVIGQARPTDPNQDILPGWTTPGALTTPGGVTTGNENADPILDNLAQLAIFERLFGAARMPGEAAPPSVEATGANLKSQMGEKYAQQYAKGAPDQNALSQPERAAQSAVLDEAQRAREAEMFRQAAEQKAQNERPAVPAEDLASLERQSKAAGIKESLKQAPAIDANNPLPALADQAGGQAVQPRVGEEHPALDAQADAMPKPEPVTVYRGGKPGDPEARFYSESKDYADNYAGRNGRVLQSEKIAPKNALDLTRPADAAVVADAFEQAGLPRPSEQKLGDGVGLAAIPPEVEAILAAKGHDWIRTGNDVEFGKETGRFWIKLKREVAAEHPSPSPNHEVIGIDADTNLPVLKRKGLEQGVTTDVPRGTIGETSGEAQAKPLSSPSEPTIAPDGSQAQGGALQSKGETGTFTTGNQPGANYSSDQLREFKAKNGIKDEPVQMVGEPPSFGAQNKLFTKEKLAKAEKAFSDKATRLNSGFDPTALKDLVDIGGYYIEGGVREFGAWSQRMIQKYGEQVKPYLAEAYKRAIAQLKPSSKADTFFSAAEDTVMAKMPNAASGEQVLGILRGVSPEELKWSGVDEFLKGKQKVSKQEVLDYLKQNNVQVKEVMHGGADKAQPLQWLESRGPSVGGKQGNPVWVSNIGNREFSIQQVGDKFHADAGHGLTEQFSSLDAAQRWMNEVRQEGAGMDGTKYASYQTPGGSNYRELLLTLPEKTEFPAAKPYRAWLEEQPWFKSGALRDPESARAKELYDEYVQRNSNGRNAPSFKGNHFAEPNVLAHVRFNDRTDAAGNKVLFVEEVQSDWHQKGRKQGYADNSESNFRAVKAEIEKKYGADVITLRDRLWRNREKGIREDALTDDMGRLDTAYARAQETQHGNTVPDAPFKKNWHELALKRILRYAAENGYDKVAWTNGEMQADRYDLSKHVKRVDYFPELNQLYAYDSLDPNTNRPVIDKIVKPEQLADYIGKEAAQKLLDSPQKTEGEGRDANVYHSLTGDDLKVGGEGMKGFYDKIIPEFLNKYGKRWGAKVGESRVVDPTGDAGHSGWHLEEVHGEAPDTWVLRDASGRYLGERDRITYDKKEAAWFDRESGHEELQKYNRPKELPVPSIDITPEMRGDVVTQGQPLYGNANRLVSTEKYQAAKKRFTDKATRMNAGLDPTALADLAEIGAYHLEAGARSFASWSSKMISELGEEVKPHLEKIWQQLSAKNPTLVQEERSPVAVKTKAAELNKQPSGAPPAPPSATVVATAAPLSDKGNFAGNINLDKLSTPEDVKAELQNVYRLNKDKIEAQRRGTVSNQQLKDLAAEVGTTPEKLGKLSKGTALNAEELLAARQTLVATGERLTSARDAWLKSRSDADLIELQAAAAEHAAVQNAVSGVTAEAGRALQQFRVMAEARRLSKEGNFEKASAILRDALGDKWAERGAELAKKLAEIPSDDAIAINKFLRDAVKAKTPEMIYEAWINSLLSNPTTHAANFISNAITRFVTPLERLVAGLGPGHYAKEAAYDFVGSYKGLAEGVRAAVRSFKTETATADIGKIELRGKAIPGAAGKVVRTSGRLLTASDEFFKVINSTAYRHAEAYRIARTEGLKGEALGKRMSDLIQNPTPEMLRAERMEALYRTFQKPLGEFGQAAMRLRNKSVIAKVIAPFVQTPTNIAKYTLERTPLNLARVLTKAAKGELKGAEFSEQISRPLVGSAISAAVAYYVADGLITGSGPKDQNKRNALRATGWQPYSLKIGNKYYAYDRLEPVGSIVGMTADVAEAVRDRGENSTTGQDIGKIAFSISKNLTSKTFLSGVSKVLDAISDPERYGQNYVEQLTSSVIPSGVGGLARATDNVQRKPGSVLDALKAKTPGKSQEVLPVRDVFGAPVTDERSAFERLISPVRTSEDKNDPAAKEVARLQAVGMDSIGGVSRKLTIRGKDVQLSDEQRDHYAEARGKALRKEFEQLLAHPGYAQLKDEQKVRLGERAKQRAYDIARMQMIRELSKSPAPPPQSRGFLEFLGVR